uniref:Histamine receptor H3 n=1 Tax=Gopherus evgoodei TaxID=1825980 RepID=A0A8C4W3K3_9SAUR
GHCTGGTIGLIWFGATWTISLAVLMALLIVATVAGNALVLLAFVVDSSLRTQNNYFLLNLAISDFLVVLDFSWKLSITAASFHNVLWIRLCTPLAKQAPFTGHTHFPLQPVLERRCG